MTSYEEKLKAVNRGDYEIEPCKNHSFPVEYIVGAGCALCYIKELESPENPARINRLERTVENLEAENKALREALEEIVKITPENEFKKWPHHHRYLIIARDALEKADG